MLIKESCVGNFQARLYLWTRLLPVLTVKYKLGQTVVIIATDLVRFGLLLELQETEAQCRLGILQYYVSALDISVYSDANLFGDNENDVYDQLYSKLTVIPLSFLYYLHFFLHRE